MPLQILLSEIGKRRLVDPILPELGRIFSSCYPSNLGLSQLSGLFNREWTVGTDRDASHRPRILFSKTNDLRPFDTRSANPGSSVSRTKTWPADGNGV